jgi:UDP-N-acetylglucosamine 3-dehydrogenase
MFKRRAGHAGKTRNGKRAGTGVHVCYNANARVLLTSSSENHVIPRTRVALIGVGRMGRNHLRVLRENPDVELVAVVDSSPEAVSEREGGFAVLSSIDQLIEFRIDLAVVATPTPTHLDVVMRMLRAGIDVLVEKPIADSRTAARELTRVASEAGRRLFVGHVERFNPVVRKLKDVVEAGIIGRPLHFSFTRVGGSPEHVGGSNNVLLDLAVHDIDILRMLVGDVSVCAAVTHSTLQHGVVDTAEVLLRAASGPTASLHVNWVTPTKIRTIRVTGSKAVCFVDYILQTCTVVGGGLLSEKRAESLSFVELQESYRSPDRIELGVRKEEPLAAQLRAVLAALRGEPSTGVCDGEASSVAVEVVEEALQNAQR